MILVTENEIMLYNLVRNSHLPPSHLWCSAPSLREERGEDRFIGLRGEYIKNTTMNCFFFMRVPSGRYVKKGKKINPKVTFKY
jgi:hypothetical protein